MTKLMNEMQANFAGLSLRRLSVTVGAEVRGVDLAAMGDERVGGITDALKLFGVLLFRRQKLDPAALVRLAQRFGDIYLSDSPKKNKFVAGFPQIYVVTNLKDASGKSMGGLGAGEAVWHSDISYLECPPKASLLYALEIPDQGGDTSVCSMAAALITMPPALRARIEGRAIKHDAIYNAGGLLRHGFEQSDDPRMASGTYHPAICRDPVSGREFLYLGRRRNGYVEGLDLAASDALLDALWAHATRPEHAYKHKWHLGDLLMWDNRMTMHKRDAFDPEARRLMHHVRLQGTAPPVAANAIAHATAKASDAW